MEDIFPETLYVTQGGEGTDSYLSPNKDESEAISATEDGESALVAQYRLVGVKKRSILTQVVDAAE